MRVMANTALASSPVSAIYDARHRASVAIIVSEIRVTSQASFSARIDGQRLDTRWMIYTGSMTVFALDVLMDRAADESGVFCMTHRAVVSALKLDRKILPVLEIAEAVIAVSKIPAMNAEVIRNQESPAEDEQSDQSDRHPQWVQYVPLHLRFPKIIIERERSTPYLVATSSQSRIEQCSLNRIIWLL